MYVGDLELAGIKYEIEDYEESRLTFHCGEISILDVCLA